MENCMTIYHDDTSGENIIDYATKYCEEVEIAIYNFKGKLVKRIKMSFQKEGEYQLIINLDKTESGIYYCILSIGRCILSGMFNV